MLELDSPEDVRKEEVLDIKKLSNILNKNFGASPKNLIIKQYIEKVFLILPTIFYGIIRNLF